MSNLPCEEAAVLLGAGASFGIVPMATDMTEVVLGGLVEDGVFTSEHSLLTVLQGLLAGPEGGQVDIEHLAQALEILSNVGPWAALIDSWASPLLELQEDEARLSHLARSAHTALTEGVATACLRKPTDLRPDTLAGLFCAHSRVPVVTLNYDNVAELSAAREGREFRVVPFAHRESPQEDQPSLVKVHGSCDLFHGGTTRGRDRDGGWSYSQILRDPQGDDLDFRRRLMIFGGGNKLRPLPALLDAYLDARAILRNASRVVVVGYSFRDDHINALLERDKGEVVVCDPSTDPKWLARVGSLFPNTEEVTRDWAPHLGVRLRRLQGASHLGRALHLPIDHLPKLKSR